MWLVFALLAPLSFAIVHILDAHCVDNIFEKPWFGVITSSFASVIVLIMSLLMFPEVSLEKISMNDALLAFGSGFLIQISQIFYFQSLSYSEPGIISAYWNMIPSLLPVVSFFAFNTVLRLNEYLGIALLVIASVLMCLVDSNLQTRWKAFVLMLFASILQTILYLIQDELFTHNPFFEIYFYVILGIILCGLLPLLFKKTRISIRRNEQKLKSAFWLIMIIEFFYLLALGLAQKSVDLGNPSLVAAIETMLPAFTFLLSLVLLFVYPKFGDEKVFNKLWLKLILVLVMITGVILLSL